MSMQHHAPSPRAQELLRSARSGQGSQLGLIAVGKSGTGTSVTAGGVAFEPDNDVVQAVQELFDQGWTTLILETDCGLRHYQLTPEGYAQVLGVGR